MPDSCQIRPRARFVPDSCQNCARFVPDSCQDASDVFWNAPFLAVQQLNETSNSAFAEPALRYCTSCTSCTLFSFASKEGLEGHEVQQPRYKCIACHSLCTYTILARIWHNSGTILARIWHEVVALAFQRARIWHESGTNLARFWHDSGTILEGSSTSLKRSKKKVHEVKCNDFKTVP